MGSVGAQGYINFLGFSLYCHQWKSCSEKEEPMGSVCPTMPGDCYNAVS